MPDSFTYSKSLYDEDNNMRENKDEEKKVLGSDPIDKLKIQLLKLVFYVFFESEKISDDVTKNTKLIVDFFSSEAERVERFEEDQCSPLYLKYVFEVLTKILSVYYTNSFIKSLDDENADTNDEQNLREEIKKFPIALKGNLRKFKLSNVKKTGLEELDKLLKNFDLSFPATDDPIRG